MGEVYKMGLSLWKEADGVCKMGRVLYKWLFIVKMVSSLNLNLVHDCLTMALVCNLQGLMMLIVIIKLGSCKNGRGL